MALLLSKPAVLHVKAMINQNNGSTCRSIVEPDTCAVRRVAKVGSLSARSKIAINFFVKCVFTISRQIRRFCA